MKVSVSWLQEYIPLEMDIHELVDALTMAGLEVDSLADRYEYLNTVLVGRIIDILPHPNADKLKICKVDIGESTIKVVCGAPNTENRMLTAAALPGTKMPDGTMIEKSTVRGETSEGMLCSEGELSLGVDFSGIMALDSSLKPGMPLNRSLDLSDMVIDIDLTPNRPDCLSILGVAREVAAIQGRSVQYPEICFQTSSMDEKDDIFSQTSVRIESPDHCPRYAARLVKGISVKTSPFWLQDRLRSVGIRPINNIVDITNFVMMETGQPLHGFDFDRLEEHRIVVRTAKDGEAFTTLDNQTHTLSRDMLMICDGKKPVALAGVMGGLNSEIEESTSRVLIESACFSPVSIRKTSKRLGLNTDASHRFERGVDPEGTLMAVDRAAQLVVHIANGSLVPGVIDEHPGKSPKKVISLSTHDTNRLLGTNLKREDIKTLLESIQFTVSSDHRPDDDTTVENSGNENSAYEDSDCLNVIPPSFRVDVKRPVDLMEEVARLYGYNKIPTTFPRIKPGTDRPTPALDLRNKLKMMMKGFGFSEAVNYSFISHQSCRRLNLPDDDPRNNVVKILNPLTDDQTDMRTVMLPGLLQTMHRNLSKQVYDLKLFEIGKIFIANNGANDLPEEIEMLTGLWTGNRFAPTWHDTGTPCDFYDIKGVVEGLFADIHVGSIGFTKIPSDKCYYTRPGYSATIEANQTEVGVLGEIHPDILKNFDLKQTAFIFELNLDTLFPMVSDTLKAEPLPKYPSISRDITLIVDNSLESNKILEKVRQIDEKLIENVYLFDIFEGKPVQQGKKSISFRITYRSANRTLADEEVNQLHRSIAKNIIEFFGAELPL